MSIAPTNLLKDPIIAPPTNGIGNSPTFRATRTSSSSSPAAQSATIGATVALPRAIPGAGLARISVRYKQTVIGVAWALIRPFLTMVVFTIIFGRFAKLPSDGAAPYALMVFAGMLPWSFFSTALTEASNSLISNANLISKVYFPRLIVPTRR